MGASSWHYFTAYDPDPAAALQRLRQEVFESGRYGDPVAAVHEHVARFQEALETGDTGRLSGEERQIWDGMQAMLDDPSWPPELRAMLRASLSGALGRGRGPDQRPASIDDLLEEAAEEGTHSILDIDHVSNRRDFGAASPLQERDLMRYFGTIRPTRAQVEAAALDVAEDLDRWEACFFVVYRDERPDEYAFIGCSGD